MHSSPPQRGLSPDTSELIFTLSVAAWGINADQDVFYLPRFASEWQQKPGKLVFLRIGPDGAVWGINAQDNIVYLSSFSSEWQQIAGSLVYLDVAENGIVWGINRDGNVYKRFGVTGNWVDTACKLKFLRCEKGTGRVWGINSGMHVCMCEYCVDSLPLVLIETVRKKPRERACASGLMYLHRLILNGTVVVLSRECGL